MSLYIAESIIHGLGLFSNIEIEKGQDICVVFNRVGAAGKFNQDFTENLYGRFVNHSINANTRIIITSVEIFLNAVEIIKPQTEITANYMALLAIFNNDPELVKRIKFW